MNIKLNSLSSKKLSAIQMNQVKGGANCTCSSSVAGNGKANYDGGKKTRLSDGGVWIPDVIVTP